MREWKMQEWKAGVENAAVENGGARTYGKRKAVRTENSIPGVYAKTRRSQLKGL